MTGPGTMLGSGPLPSARAWAFASDWRPTQRVAYTFVPHADTVTVLVVPLEAAVTVPPLVPAKVKVLPTTVAIFTVPEMVAPPLTLESVAPTTGAAPVKVPLPVEAAACTPMAGVVMV